MKNTPYLLPILLILCAFCKKDSPSLVEQTFTAGTWYLTGYFYDANNDGVFESQLFDCQQNDGWNFAAAHYLELRDELPYCDEDVDTLAIISGNWYLQNNDTEIRMVFADSSFIADYHIHMMNDTLLELRAYNDPVTQAPPEERFTFRR